MNGVNESEFLKVRDKTEESRGDIARLQERVDASEKSLELAEKIMDTKFAPVIIRLDQVEKQKAGIGGIQAVLLPIACTVAGGIVVGIIMLLLRH